MDNYKDNIIKVLNHFENDSGSFETDYSTIYLYKDGPNETKQFTIGRGYVESGSAWKVFEIYRDLGGKSAEKLLSYRKEKGKETLPRNKEFLHLIVEAALNEKEMRQAQDLVFNDMYWSKGLDYFSKFAFNYNLSLAVIEDSILHSGSMLGFLTGSFPEKKPCDGGNEKAWVESYLRVRRAWLLRKGGILANTIYRADFFLQEIKRDNWDFNTPMNVWGKKLE